MSDGWIWVLAKWSVSLFSLSVGSTKTKKYFFSLNSVSVGVWWPQWPESTLRWLVAFVVKEQQQLEQGADCWRWVSDLSVSPSKFDVFSHGCQKFELILQIRAGYPKISCRTYSIFRRSFGEDRKTLLNDVLKHGLAYTAKHGISGEYRSLVLRLMLLQREHDVIHSKLSPKIQQI